MTGAMNSASADETSTRNTGRGSPTMMSTDAASEYSIVIR